MTARELLSPFFSGASLPESKILRVTERTSLADNESVFVCIKGAHADGHELAPLAYENGCRVFVAERPLSLPEDATVLLCDCTRKMLARLACRFYGDPSQKMQVVGITGTKGKTTTAELILHILNQNGIPTGYIGTNGVRYGDVHKDIANTTPDAVTLQGALAEMAQSGMRAAVVEISSQALMQNRADGTRLCATVFTNLSSDHVGPLEHPTVEHYHLCKRRLFSEFGARLAVWNADDSAFEKMRKASGAREHVTCSLFGRSATLGAEEIRPVKTERSLGVSFVLKQKEKVSPVYLPLAGACNAMNAMEALAVATQCFAIPLPKAIHALESVTVKGRSEYIPLPHGACAVIDYAHNGESLRQILSSLRPYTSGRLCCLFGSVGERSQLRRRELGNAAAALSDLAILTSDNPGREDPDQIIAEIEEAFLNTNTPYVKIPDRREAIEYALRQLRPNDVLLIAGKGQEEYQLIGTKKLPFCEREIVEEYARTAFAAITK